MVLGRQHGVWPHRAHVAQHRERDEKQQTTGDDQRLPKLRELRLQLRSRHEQTPRKYGAVPIAEWLALQQQEAPVPGDCHTLALVDEGSLLGRQLHKLVVVVVFATSGPCLSRRPAGRPQW